MRKPRDFESELKALSAKARDLKARRVRQLGELVVTTGADALDGETLTGALLAAIESTDASTKEAWRGRGARFFQERTRPARRSARAQPGRAATSDDGKASD